MSASKRVAFVTADRAAFEQCQKELQKMGHFAAIAVFVETLRSKNDLKAKLKGFAQAITGELDGNIDTRFAILDSSFSSGDGGKYAITDPLIESLPGYSGSLLNVLLGAGIPVLVNYREDSVAASTQSFLT